MKRALLAFGILGVIGAGLAALWTLRTPSPVRSKQDSLKETVESVVTNPVAFAKSRFTGGIGAILLVDPKTGVPVIHQVIAGSPAAAAGLRDGDVVLKVDGVVTSGQKLAQVVDSIRGFAAGSVTPTIQRTGSTNLECVLHRSSWKRLGVPQ
jgi:C-terminal processing protease CtpA/Prc